MVGFHMLAGYVLVIMTVIVPNSTYNTSNTCYFVSYDVFKKTNKSRKQTNFINEHTYSHTTIPTYSV